MILFNFQYINSQILVSCLFFFLDKKCQFPFGQFVCAAFRMMQEEAVRLCMDDKEK